MQEKLLSPLRAFENSMNVQCLVIICAVCDAIGSHHYLSPLRRLFSVLWRDAWGWGKRLSMTGPCMIDKADPEHSFNKGRWLVIYAARWNGNARLSLCIQRSAVSALFFAASNLILSLGTTWIWSVCYVNDEHRANYWLQPQVLSI